MLELHSAFQFDSQSNRRASPRSILGAQIHSIIHRLFEGGNHRTYVDSFFGTRGNK